MQADLSTQSATRLWDELALALERFLEAWERDSAPPPLRDYLPTEPAALRRMTLEELVKADLEQRARSGAWRSLDDYLREFPELASEGEPSAELIYEAYHWRRGADEELTPEEWLARYPRNAPRLERLMELAPRATTQLRESRSHQQLQPGQRLDDFELVARVGQGAFASVFLARQVSMQRLVALKVSADRGSEPQMLAQLDHPHIVRVYDQRVVAEQGWRLLYMQFAPGGTLQEVVERVAATRTAARSGKLLLESIDSALQRAGQLPPETSAARRRWSGLGWSEAVCRLGAPLAHALAYAHQEGILHRDVKPANVLLTAEGAPKLADFNISFDSHVANATPAAYFGGSLAYMSPEQLAACHPARLASAAELDERSDLYSLSVLLWELLHGERPFRDEPLGERWSATLDAMLARRRARRIETPLDAPDDRLAARVRTVLERALAPEPAERPRSGTELARELYLCTQPQAWDLLCRPAAGWREFARRRPFLLLTLAILPPNMLGGAFNYWYNEQAIIDPLGAPAADVFYWVQLVINATAFPLGLAILAAVAWPLGRTLQRLTSSPSPTVEQLSIARRRALLFGHMAAAVGICEWVIAGVLFPLGLDAALDEFPWTAYVHFFFSMVVCGAVAAAFPFFGATELALRAFYPTLLGRETIDEDERRRLTGLGQQSMGYLLAAVGVPLAGLLLLIGSGADNRLVSALLVLAGLIGMLVAFWSHSRIRRQSLLLAAATRPVETIVFDTETVDA